MKELEEYKKWETQMDEGIDYLLLDGNINVGKDVGQGKLLLTRTSLFALRVGNRATIAGVASAGLLGAIIGHFIDRQYAKSGPPPQHMDDPEIQDLHESVRNKIKRTSLLVKLPLNSDLMINRTLSGFKFTYVGKTTVAYQGLIHKNKIAEFLGGLGIDVG